MSGNRWINVVLRRWWGFGGELIPMGTWWNPDEPLNNRKVVVLKGLVRKFPRTLKIRDLRTLRWDGVPSDIGKTQGVLALAKKGRNGRVVAITSCPSMGSPDFENARKRLCPGEEPSIGLELVYEMV